MYQNEKNQDRRDDVGLPLHRGVREEQLYDAGMDVVRVNSAHVSEDGATHIVETVHRVNPAIPIMIDTKGPEIRVTTIADEYGNSINFRAGDRVAVRGSDGCGLHHPQGGLHERAVDRARHSGRGADADRRRRAGNPRRGARTTTELDCEFVVGGAMRSRKSVNVPGVSIDLPSVTEKDRRFIEWAVKNDVDFIAHSFVRSGARHPGRAGDSRRPRQQHQDHLEDREPGGTGQHRRDHRGVVRHHGRPRRPGRGASRPR